MAPNNELPPIESYHPATRETVKILRGDDWPSLLLHLEDLAGMIDEAIAPEVLRLVGSDAPVEVRAAAAIALGPTLEECDGEFDDGAVVLAGFLGPPISEATYRQILEVLHRELGDDRYRPCPLLRKYAAAGWLGRKSGRGFYEYS